MASLVVQRKPAPLCAAITPTADGCRARCSRGPAATARANGGASCATRWTHGSGTNMPGRRVKFGPPEPCGQPARAASGPGRLVAHAVATLVGPLARSTDTGGRDVGRQHRMRPRSSRPGALCKFLETAHGAAPTVAVSTTQASPVVTAERKS